MRTRCCGILGFFFAQPRLLIHARMHTPQIFFRCVSDVCDGLEWNRTTENGRYWQAGSECVYCSSSSGPRTSVLVLAVMCQCVCAPSRSHYRTLAAEIDAMCVALRPSARATVVVTQKNMLCPHGRCYYPLTFILRPLSSWRRGTARLLPLHFHLRDDGRGARTAWNGRGDPDRGACARFCVLTPI